MSVRPDLSWRDLQYLALQTAVPVNLDDGDWQDTTIGKKFSHKYGYGKIDAYGAVEAAKAFKSVKPQAWYNSAWMHVKLSIPEGDQGLASSVEITKEQLKDANLERLEHVTVTMNVAHERRGDLSVELRSPDGIVSHLSATRRNDKSTSGYQDWTFMSVVHWCVPLNFPEPMACQRLIYLSRGESGIGKWTVIVKDTSVNEFHGMFTDWKITLWGECIDEAKATLLPMPTEEDDADHNAIKTVMASTTSISTGGQPTGSVVVNPTDHPERPVNSKPTSEGESESKPTSTPSATSTPESSPTSQPNSNFLPSFFPTFGVSKRTQVWIYGSIAIITLFCAAIGTYLYLARRKHIRNSVRDDYEFEVLDDQEDELGRNVGSGKKAAGRRGGELYDAFAAESDEELFSGDEERYRDEEEERRDEDGGTGDPGGKGKRG